MLQGCFFSSKSCRGLKKTTTNCWYKIKDRNPWLILTYLVLFKRLNIKTYKYIAKKITHYVSFHLDYKQISLIVLCKRFVSVLSVCCICNISFISWNQHSVSCIRNLTLLHRNDVFLTGDVEKGFLGPLHAQQDVWCFITCGSSN